MQTVNKLDSNIGKMLLDRLQDEFNAYYFYRSASNWCKSAGYIEASEYFAEESKDELAHAKILEDFMVDWNVIPNLPVINTPKLVFSSLIDVIEQAYKIEYALYEEYEDTGVKIFKLGDLCVFGLLQGFITIQKDSVVSYSDMLNLLEGIDAKDKYSLLTLQSKLF